MILIWGTAWAFYRTAGGTKIDQLFGASQFLLLGITYASINFGTTYINLTGPVTVALVFFTIARIYATGTSRALEHTALRSSLAQDGELNATLLLVRLNHGPEILSASLQEKIRLALENTGTAAKSVAVIKHRQRGLWELFEFTFAISWVAPSTDDNKIAAMRADVTAFTEQLPQVLGRFVKMTPDAAEWLVYERPIFGGVDARAGWRVLFAEALLKWNDKGLKT